MDPRKTTELLCPLRCGESGALMPATPLVDDLEATVRSQGQCGLVACCKQTDKRAHREVGAERELHSGQGCTGNALRK